MTSTNSTAQPSTESTKLAERRTFRMHPDLLWSVIQSQAGTADKALLEGVMNAVDAGATRCDIELSATGFRIVDDGRGFESRQTVEDFFETFGTPHKEGDATYGKFRMGRGQLFSFAFTTWRTGTFLMSVDIKKLGLDYDLRDDLEHTPGCAIEGTWYDPLDSAKLYRLAHDLGRLCAWMQIVVTVDARQVNRFPADAQWDLETKDAYLKCSPSGGLTVYNMGALVRIYAAEEFGVSGVVVSKRALTVNFARNDLLTSKCTVWRSIKRQLDGLRGALVTKKVLTDAERDAIARAFAAGEMAYQDIANVRLLLNAKGNHVSLASLRDSKVCMAANLSEQRIGEKIMDAGLAICLAQGALSRFGISTLAELDKLLYPHSTGGRSRSISVIYRGFFKACTVHELAPDIKSFYKILDSTKLGKQQAAVLAGLQGMADKVCKKLNEYLIATELGESKRWSPSGDTPRWWKEAKDNPRLARRVVVLGQSDTAQAWTDGATFIAINIDQIRRMLENRRFLSTPFLYLILHEYCHRENDEQAHTHGPEFYRLFHDYQLEWSEPWETFAAEQDVLVGYLKGLKAVGSPAKSHLLVEHSFQADLIQRVEAAGVAGSDTTAAGAIN